MEIDRRKLLIAAAGASTVLAGGAGVLAAAEAPAPTAPAGGPPERAGSQPRGFSSPLRYEASIDDCEVVGKIPGDLNGAFYRVGGEWYYPPLFADDAPLNTDGYVSMFRFKGGKVDFKGRWVQTHRFKKEREARRQLYGYYRNPYTDDPSVQDPKHPNLRTVSNTSTIAHGGKLFTSKEDGLPHQINPNTLETIGPWDFNGRWKSETFTAHPKLDPVSGEMVAFGYEATGLATDDLWIYTINRAGAVTREVRIKVPYVSMVHDMALTQKHIVIPFGGYTTSLEKLKAKKIHWEWDSSKPSYIGVIPRDGDARDVRWFKGPMRCMMHTFNAHTEGNKVILYAPFYDGNFFPFFPNTDGSPFNPRYARGFIRKYTLDLDSRSDQWQEETLWPNSIVDLGKVDPRVLTQQTRYLFMPYVDPSRPFDKAAAFGPAPRTATNSYLRYDLQTGKTDTFFAGSTHSLQEPTFVPRGSGNTEGEGYLVGIASNYAENRSELVIADAQRLGDGDVARVILPFAVSSQVHGHWSNAAELQLT
ncbi:MAG: carotenoid oxygenase family protein [Pseudomonadota bacterium]